jgi:choline dehydrogenase-like flavoprotein
MSRVPKYGVVDVTRRVRDVENLFEVSGAVFPTGSQANPTLTIVSLALRLAEFLSAAQPKNDISK